MDQQAVNAHDSRTTTKGVAMKIVGIWIALPLFFLVIGGSLRWWEAWAYCVVLLVPMTLFLVRVARTDPEFIARRTKMKEKEHAQRRILAWGYPALLGTLLIPGLDHRLGWSNPSPMLVMAALVVVLGGYLVVLWVFAKNRWAGRTIETYQDQEVISTGPYAIVRHPMYTAVLAGYLATPLALGSFWALLPALAFVPIVISRIRNEEQVLVRELPGYEAYRRRVRFRLVPLVW